MKRNEREDTQDLTGLEDISDSDVLDIDISDDEAPSLSTVAELDDLEEIDSDDLMENLQKNSPPASFGMEEVEKADEPETDIASEEDRDDDKNPGQSGFLSSSVDDAEGNEEAMLIESAVDDISLMEINEDNSLPMPTLDLETVDEMEIEKEPEEEQESNKISKTDKLVSSDPEWVDETGTPEWEQPGLQVEPGGDVIEIESALHDDYDVPPKEEEEDDVRVLEEVERIDELPEVAPEPARTHISETFDDFFPVTIYEAGSQKASVKDDNTEITLNNLADLIKSLESKITGGESLPADRGANGYCLKIEPSSALIVVDRAYETFTEVTVLVDRPFINPLSFQVKAQIDSCYETTDIILVRVVFDADADITRQIKKYLTKGARNISFLASLRDLN